MLEKYKERSSEEEFVECFFGESRNRTIAESAWNSLGALAQTQLNELWDADFPEFIAKHYEEVKD